MLERCGSLRETVELWRADRGITVAAQMVAPEGVRHDKHYIEIIH